MTWYFTNCPIRSTCLGSHLRGIRPRFLPGGAALFLATRRVFFGFRRANPSPFAFWGEFRVGGFRPCVELFAKAFETRWLGRHQVFRFTHIFVDIVEFVIVLDVVIDQLPAGPGNDAGRMAALG